MPNQPPNPRPPDTCVHTDRSSNDSTAQLDRSKISAPDLLDSRAYGSKSPIVLEYSWMTSRCWASALTYLHADLKKGLLEAMQHPTPAHSTYKGFFYRKDFFSSPDSNTYLRVTTSVLRAHGSTWQYMAVHGSTWQYMAVS